MTAERYYVKRPSGKVFGPFDKNAIGMMLKSKKLDVEAEVSKDKDQWISLTQIPEFAQILGDMGVPVDLPAGAGNLPSLPKPGGLDLPSPISGQGGLDLPRPMGVPDLPSPISGQSGMDLPKPISPPDLPAPMGTPDLPSPSAGNLSLPKPGPPPNLPQPIDASQVGEEDLFGSPMSVMEDEDDLFGGGGHSIATEDDLFGGGASAASMADEEDLFGGVDHSIATEDDLFGGPPPSNDGFGQAGSSDFGNVDFGSDDGQLDEDGLFGSSDHMGNDNDLFGGPSESVSLKDDLFGDAALEGDDDFLGGEQGFSFLDESPTGSALGGNMDSWGDDLISQQSAPGDTASPFMGNSTEDAFIGNGVQSNPLASAPSTPSTPAANPGDPFRPASTGIRDDAAEPGKPQTGKTGAPDEDKKRGLAVKIGLPILIFCVLGGIGFALIKVFGNQDVTPVTKPNVAKRVKVELAKLKKANFAELREIINTSKKASMKPDAVGKVLVAHALVLARYDDPAILKNAKTLMGKVTNAKSDNALLGKGAFDAVTSDYDSAKASLEPLLGKGGDVGLFANLFMGIAAAKVATNDNTEAPPAKEKPADKSTDKGEDKSENDKKAVAKDVKKDGKSDVNAEDKPEDKAPKASPKKADKQMIASARKHLKAAQAINPVIPGYWMGRVAEIADKQTAAIKSYKVSLKGSEEYVPSLVALGRMYYVGGDLNDAMKRLEKVTTTLSAYAHNKDKAIAYYYSGKVYAARSQSELAIKNYTKALEFDTTRADTLRDLANEYEHAKKYKEALNFFTTGNNLGKKDPDVLLGVVRAYKGLKQWEQAIAQLEVGEKKFPEDARFPEQLGELNMSRGTFSEAQKAFERAVEINPSILSAHASLAQLAWHMDKDFSRGEKHVRKIVAQPKKITAPVAMNVAEFYRISERMKVAQQWYGSAIKRDPNFWPARLALSRLLLEKGKTKKALNLLERSRKEGVKDIRLSAYLADAYRQSKMYDRAIDEINRVIEKYPKNPRYIFIRGRIYFDRGNYETALEDFNKAYELDTRFHDAYFFVGRTAFEQGDVKTAMKIFRHVLDYVPNNGDYRFFMGQALEKQGRMTQALEEYRKVTEVDSAYGVRNPNMYIVRGRLMGKLSYVREGRKDIARALELAPNNVDALIAMGELDFNEKQYEESVNNLTRALDKNPKRPEAQQKLGMSYIYLKRPNDGAKHLQLAIRYGYKDPDIYRTLGYLYKDLGQKAAALKAFKAFWKASAGKKGVPRGTQREILQQIKALGG